MTEQTLPHLTLERLFDQLLLNTKELLEAIEKKDDTNFRIKKAQIELLRGLINANYAETNYD